MTIHYDERDEDYLSDEQDELARVQMLAETCPMCGEYIIGTDYDPPDPSVGIFTGVYYNECREHGPFYTYDDGSQEMED